MKKITALADIAVGINQDDGYFGSSNATSRPASFAESGKPITSPVK